MDARPPVRPFAAIGAAVSSLLATSTSYGFDYQSYLWRGFGMYTQLWAMIETPRALLHAEEIDRFRANQIGDGAGVHPFERIEAFGIGTGQNAITKRIGFVCDDASIIASGASCLSPFLVQAAANVVPDRCILEAA